MERPVLVSPLSELRPMWFCENIVNLTPSNSWTVEADQIFYHPIERMLEANGNVCGC